jgi:Cu/Ag efflux protein CusF
MKRLVVGVGVLAAVVLVSMARTATAQSKTFSSEIRVETGTVEAVDAVARTVTLKKPDGTVVTTVAGPDVKRFAEIKIGDKITARYYENVVVRVKRPGEKDTLGTSTATTPSEQVMPGGTRAQQRTITATIAAIDMNTPSITFTGPNGWKYTSKVQDKAALATVKAGDKVDIVWTEALLVSLEPGK